MEGSSNSRSAALGRYSTPITLPSTRSLHYHLNTFYATVPTSRDRPATTPIPIPQLSRHPLAFPPSASLSTGTPAFPSNASATAQANDA